MNRNKISFIIPIRNELKNLKINENSYKKILGSHHQLILIDDMSTDGSLEFIKEKFKTASIVIISDRKDKKIIGKNYALLEGIKLVKNEVLCFVDADVYNINLNEIEQIVALKKIKEVYTTIPTFINNSLSENFSLFFQQILTLNFHILNPKNEIFGGFYIIDKSFYEEIGTHEKVKYQIVEDLEIGKLIAKKGKIKSFKSKYMTIHMYSSYKDLYQGWRKNISYSAKNINFSNLIILTSYIFLLVVLIINTRLSYKYILINYLIISFLFIITKKYYLKTKSIYLFLWPIYLINFIFIFFLSIIIKEKKWKGRRY